MATMDNKNDDSFKGCSEESEENKQLLARSDIKPVSMS